MTNGTLLLHNPNATGNITKWAAELVEFELDFVPRHAVKSQVLADFIIDWTPSASPLGGPDDSEPEPRASVFTGPHWTLFFDGSSHKQGVWLLTAGSLPKLWTEEVAVQVSVSDV
jgi:hypothetical protein